jgi:hypothetical protein
VALWSQPRSPVGSFAVVGGSVGDGLVGVLAHVVVAVAALVDAVVGDLRVARESVRVGVVAVV